jgi:hypothetical protein
MRLKHMFSGEAPGTKIYSFFFFFFHNRVRIVLHCLFKQ